MFSILLALILLQTPAVRDNGRITGILRMAAGQPARGVRVAASPSDSPDGASIFVSLSETDKEGRFVLENIPPGRYFIVAGRIDAPTFYPGTLEPSKRETLTVSAGATISDIEIVVADASLLPVISSGPSGTPRRAITMPVSVTMEDGTKAPALSTPVGPSAIRVTRVRSGGIVQVPLGSSGIPVSVSTEREEYRVEVANLPDGYNVKSITWGSTDLMKDTLAASVNDFAPGALRVVTYTGQGELQSVIDQITRERNAPPTLFIVLTRQ